ncbi:MAG: HNH endonuclease signature motif containing protein [Candidatus Thiothrix putei]|uniref:HNH endonuclease signature motif containing protein n=1 Tax=Candidatus Thiothrix putei TaxID=3080811 RepID=A0AA95HG76_9GAMM|nr:MAG: HNH endonuclease signature motif containing protein [Candidatus Thiothrix putei]
MDVASIAKARWNIRGQSFEFDHIAPISRAGETSLENLALACGGCNRHKSNKVQGIDPATGDRVELFNPRQQQWEVHFGWTDDYTQMIGLTAIGRATVAALKLNRIGLVNMRRVLCMAGKHPA